MPNGIGPAAESLTGQLAALRVELAGEQIAETPRDVLGLVESAYVELERLLQHTTQSFERPGQEDRLSRRA